MKNLQVEEVMVVSTSATSSDGIRGLSFRINQYLKQGWDLYGGLTSIGEKQMPAVMLVKYVNPADWRDEGGPL